MGAAAATTAADASAGGLGIGGASTTTAAASPAANVTTDIGVEAERRGEGMDTEFVGEGVHSGGGRWPLSKR